MSDVIDKPKDKFNFRDLLAGLDKMAAQTDKCDDPECPACHPETAPKQDFLSRLLDMPNQDRAYNAKMFNQLSANLSGLGLLLTLKQQMGDKDKVFQTGAGYSDIMATLTIASMIVGTFGDSIAKMSDEDFAKAKERMHAQIEAVKE